MTSTLQRLLKYPHAAVFDKASGGELALRIRHPDGAVWKVENEVLTAAAGSLERTYHLSQYTISGLAGALAADGFEVPTLAPQWASRSALVLAEGGGDQGASNGDHVQAFTSILWALLSGYGGEVREAEGQVAQALRQMVITQAEGQWLDLWGMLYAQGREPGEVDADYALRIPKEAFRLRVNARGIEQAIRDATGYDVRIEEPWTEIFTLDHSLLSGPDKLYDGELTGYHLIRPESRESVDWERVLEIINRNRAAGVLVIYPQSIRIVDVDCSGTEVEWVHIGHRLEDVRYEDTVLLDYMNIEDVSILNEPFMFQRNRLLITEAVMTGLGWIEEAWIPIPWNAPPYLAFGFHSRTYRIYLTTVPHGQSWLPELTWSDPGRSWADSAFVEGFHFTS